MNTDLPQELRQIADQQSGVVTRTQTLAAGISDRVVAALIRRGSWQRLYPGVYAAFSGQLSREAALWAAVLRGGPGAALSHKTAAELWGLSTEMSSPMHLTIPIGRRIDKTPGLAVHLAVNVAVHPAQTPPRTRLEETVIDLWQEARSLDSAVAWVTSAIGRRLTTQDKLRRAMGSRKRVRWRSQLAELLSPDLAGIHSVLEYRYVRDVERPHRLPAGRRQAASRRNRRAEYRDTLYEEYQTVVELDGRVAHPDDSRWDDIHRDNAAITAGLATLRYGWRDVTLTACATAAEVADALAQRGYDGARPCTAGCPVGASVRRQSRPRASVARISVTRKAQRASRAGPR